MSWSYEYVAASKADARSINGCHIRDNKDYPRDIACMVDAAVDALPDPPERYLVYVRTSGHIFNSKPAAGGSISLEAKLLAMPEPGGLIR